MPVESAYCASILVASMTSTPGVLAMPVGWNSPPLPYRPPQSRPSCIRRDRSDAKISSALYLVLIISSRVWGTMASSRLALRRRLPKVGWVVLIFRASPPQVARVPEVMRGMLMLPVSRGMVRAPSSLMTVLS